MYVETKTLSPAIQRALQALDFHVKDIEVEAVNEVSLASPSGREGARGFTCLINLDTGKYEVSRGSWGGANMFVQRPVDVSDESLVLQPHMVVIQGSSGHPRTFARIVCSPEATGKFLPPAEKDELTETQQAAINIYWGIKSSYRPEYLGRSKVTKSDIESLIERGYLKRNKAQAISLTTKGKNAKTNVSPY